MCVSTKCHSLHVICIMSAINFALDLMINFKINGTHHANEQNPK